MIEIKIKTENAAFCDPFTGETDIVSHNLEIIRIIKEQVIPTLENFSQTEINLHDINGNTVGRMVIKS